MADTLAGNLMEEEHGKIEGNLTISDKLILFGMCTGNVAVVSGGVLTLHGLCTGNIVVYPGGTVHLRGMVTGNVHNAGGLVEIYGVVNGNLDREGGTTNIYPNAVIGGG
jgi:cytoskeletal protein CcmA (bactofilin family)